MYELLKKDGMAKRGRFHTVHGTIETPVFMNVGTAAAIKGAVSTDDLRGIKTQVELSNTYHLHVRPGDKVVKQLGGLHKFIEPSPVMLPINVMEIAIRPLSLCMRLFGNILGGFVVMELIKLVVPVLVPIPFSLYFDLFDGFIQTIVFVFLTALFVGEAVEE